MLDKHAKAAAQLAKKQPVRVVGPGGEVHRVLDEREQAAQEALDLTGIAQIDQQVRATLATAAALAAQVEAMAARLETVLALVEKAAQGQSEFSGELRTLTETLKMPIMPVYGKNGLLRAGVRVEKLPEER